MLHAEQLERAVRRGTDDLVFVVIEKADPRYEDANTRALLERVGGVRAR